MQRCDFRAERECSCGPNECRVQNLGTVRKVSDLTGVFTPSASIQFAFLAWVVLTAAIGFGAYQLHQIDKQIETAGRV